MCLRLAHPSSVTPWVALVSPADAVAAVLLGRTDRLMLFFLGLDIAASVEVGSAEALASVDLLCLLEAKRLRVFAVSPLTCCSFRLVLVWSVAADASPAGADKRVKNEESTCPMLVYPNC